jgi:hypothetical protein
MNAAAPWVRVLLAPWQQRRNEGAVWPFLTFIGVLSASALVGAVVAPVPALRVFAWSVLSIPLFGGWVWLVLSLMQQNHPTAARLVPGQLRTLRRVLFGAWLALTSLAALFGSAFGHALAVAAGVGALLLLLMWIVRVPLLSLVLWIVPASSARWAHTPVAEAVLRRITAAWHRQPEELLLAGLLALLVAMLASVFLVLRAGGARHASAYLRRARQLAAVREGVAGPSSWRGGSGMLNEWLGQGALGFYRRWLARVSTQRRGAMLPRALLGLGPTTHWTGQLGQLVTFGGVAALVLFFLWQANAGADSIPVAAWGLAIGVLTFAANVALQARTAIHSTRREQALIMLLPGMPRGRALNQGLARRLSMQFIIGWAIGVLACVLLLPLGEHIDWFAIYAAACLPLGALVWTDWSRVKAPTAMSAVVPLMVVMPLVLVAIALQAWMNVPAWACVLVFAVAAVLLVARRARRLIDAPSAFPAGRLA